MALIDLHSHILPGIDDGSPDLDHSLAMAEAFVADGVAVVAATPHILPGVYANSGPDIRDRLGDLQGELDRRGIPLALVTGADVHIAPNLVGGLASGHLLSLADSRYVLIEPPHHVAPMRLEDTFFELLLAGYVPILTHPERLSWIKNQYPMLGRLAKAGVWMQITSGSLRGAFGQGPKALAEQMLDDGLVHILASDAHDVSRRRPDLSIGAQLAAKRVGDEAAQDLVLTRPQAILDNRPASSLPTPPARSLDDRFARGGSKPSRGTFGGDDVHSGTVGHSGGWRRWSQRLRQFVGR